MTIGTGTFIPNYNFVAPRSYVYGLNIARYGTTITRALGQFTIHAVPPNPTIAILQIDNNYYFWNSNSRGLDHIVTEWYALVNGLPPQSPLNFTLSWVYDHTRHRAMLQFEWFSGFPDFEFFPLPPPPASYWLPKPLP